MVTSSISDFFLITVPDLTPHILLKGGSSGGRNLKFWIIFHLPCFFIAQKCCQRLLQAFWSSISMQVVIDKKRKPSANEKLGKKFFLKNKIIFRPTDPNIFREVTRTTHFILFGLKTYLGGGRGMFLGIYSGDQYCTWPNNFPAL